VSLPGELRVAVITPYYQEAEDVLRTCYDSVRRQSYACTHFLVADGSPRLDVLTWPAEHIVLPRPHEDLGNTPRAIGSLAAMNQGFDAIAFLDADNWYCPDHVEAMVDLHRRTGAAVCTAGRTIHRLDGSLLYVDKHDCDGQKHVDTSCLFLTRPAFRLLPLWAMMPQQLSPIGDTVMWQTILQRRLAHAHSPRPTVAFRTQYQVHYRIAGETPPPHAKSNAESIDRALGWWRALPEQQRDDWIKYFGSF
jgi:glycosyltransferase involved in cell wall biosynthesis